MKTAIWYISGILFLMLSIPDYSDAQSSDNYSQLNVSIGIVSDVHADVMPDIPERLQKFIDEASKNNVDLIIQMGDFCRPLELEKEVFDVWNSFEGDKYHVLGNHDMDFHTKEEIVDFWNMPSAYYSFDQEGIHFVVLDANYLYEKGKYIDYSRANFYVSSEKRAYINPEQLEWLKQDLEKTDKPTLVFSHQSLINTFWGIKNQIEVQEVLEAANKKAGFTKVIACFNGHDHIDLHREINGIHYFEINSLGYQWMGESYTGNKCNINDSTLNYKHLNKIASYKDPLYAIVRIENGFLKIKGVQSEWDCSSPQENGIPKAVYGAQLSPEISDYNIKIK